MRIRNKGTIIAATIAFIVLLAAVFIYLANNVNAEITAEEAAIAVLEQYDGEVLDSVLEGQHYIVKLRMDKGLYEVKVRSNDGEIYEITTVEQFVADRIDDPTTQAPGATDNPNPTQAADSEPGDPTKTPTDGTETSEPTGNPKPKPTANSTAAPKPSTVPTEKPIATKNPTEKPSKPTSKPTDMPSKPPAASSTPKPKESSSSTNSPLVSEERAREIALKQVAGKVEDIDLERKGEVRYYLVEVETSEGKEAEVQINAASGKVMSITWGDDDDDDDE